MISNVDRKKLIIDNCKNMTTKLNVKNVDSSIKRIIRFNNVTKISTRFSITISFKLRDKNSLFVERDFMFIFQRIDRLNLVDDVFSHIVDAHIFVIQVMNANVEEIFIFKNSKLSIIQNYAEEECFLVNQKNVDLAANSDIQRSISSAFKN